MNYFKMPEGFTSLLAEHTSAPNIESRIRLGITQSAMDLWQTYWQRCFEGKHSKAIPIETPFEPYLMACHLWTTWIKERRSKWQEKAQTYVRFGRHEDALKEEFKLSQLELISKVWMQEVQKKWIV